MPRNQPLRCLQRNHSRRWGNCSRALRRRRRFDGLCDVVSDGQSYHRVTRKAADSSTTTATYSNDQLNTRYSPYSRPTTHHAAAVHGSSYLFHLLTRYISDWNGLKCVTLGANIELNSLCNYFNSSRRAKYFDRRVCMFVCLSVSWHVLKTEYGRRPLHSSTDRTLTVPRTHNRFGDRSFAVAGPRLWNSLPISLRQISSFGQFRRYLKSLLFVIWEITAQCDAWFSALYKYSYLLTYVSKLHEIFCTCYPWPWLNRPLMTLQ